MAKPNPHAVENLFLFAVNTGARYPDFMQTARLCRAMPSRMSVAWANWARHSADDLRRQQSDTPPFTAVELLMVATRLAQYYDDHLNEM